MNFKTQYIFKGVLNSLIFLFCGWYLGNLIPFGSTFLANTYNFVILTGTVVLLGYTLYDADIRVNAEYEELLQKRFLPFPFPKGLVFFILLLIFVNETYFTGKNINNTNIHLVKDYEKETQSIAGLYDNMWLTYKEKMNILSLNKETFLQVTQMVFENRKDGDKVTWKWLQENQPVPYTEFSKFYTDLSAYIETKRDAIYNIELRRQALAAEQGKLLSVFPNSIFSSVLGLKKINYEYKILSEHTKNVLKKGSE